MKNIILFSLALIAISFSKIIAQSETQSTVAKFIVLDAKKNGNDVSSRLINEGAYTVFYTSGNDGLIYMANVWPKSQTQSFGPMYGVETEKVKETFENYEADFFYFNWSYTNTYDNQSGTAKVQVIKIYKPQGIAFTIKIITEDLDVIQYKGYMEGTIDFSIYD